MVSLTLFSTIHFDCIELYIPNFYQYFVRSFSTESKFHFVVERNPLRENSKAWERVTSSGGKRVIPTEMEAWVNGGSVVEAETIEINGTEEKEAALQ